MKNFFAKLFSKQENALPPPAKPMIIAVDFDGTCVKDGYPNIGDPMPGAVQTLKALLRRDHKLILWTCREGQQLQDAVDWCQKHDITLVGINQTPLDLDFRANGGTKIFANVYIDDRNFGGFPGWHYIHQQLIGMPLIA